jgi:hypothetical protein
MILTQDVKDKVLTPRWFPIPQVALEHPAQIACRNSRSQFKVIAAGRRSFKTERFIKRKFTHCGIANTDEAMFIGAPTHAQAKLIFWDDLKALTPAWCLKDVSESELFIRFRSGSRLKVVGLDAYERVEGARWTRAAVTEMQLVDPEFFANSLQPILNDTGGEGILEGRPLGKNHFWELYQKAQSDPARWSSFHWRSSDILSKSQIDAALSDMAKEDYEREYNASFEASSQRVYYSYSVLNNQKFQMALDRPVIITCDFNAMEKPMSWVVGQMNGNDMYWTKGLSFSYTNTSRMCELLEEYLTKYFDGKFPKDMVFYGDYSGTKHTSNSSRSDWEIIIEHFRNKTNVVKKTKPCLDIRDRNASTNGRLCNAKGERRMFVDAEECKELVRDWEQVTRKENGIDLNGDDAKRTHSSDAVDYHCAYEYPIRGKARGVQYGVEERKN